MFEWDEAKSRANESKHRIPFSVVPACFEGPLLATVDERFAYGEERWKAIGMLEHVPVVIVDTKRGHRIRIISARKANAHERKEFQRILAARGR